MIIKKEYSEFYLPKTQPSIVDVPKMNYVAVWGAGDPNEENGEYSAAMPILYSISYTIKMSYKGSRMIEGYFEYVVPPLEGLWWMGDGSPGLDHHRKADLNWISMIRLPEFVTPEIFEWARGEAAKKKGIDMSKAVLFPLEEGLCVQCMHIGPFDKEPETVARMDAYVRENGYVSDLSEERRHHEIYLGDPRKIAPEKFKTVIRHPVRRS